jgi:hypothetical protein
MSLSTTIYFAMNVDEIINLKELYESYCSYFLNENNDLYTATFEDYYVTFEREDGYMLNVCFEDIIKNNNEEEKYTILGLNCRGEWRQEKLEFVIEKDCEDITKSEIYNRLLDIKRQYNSLREQHYRIKNDLDNTSDYYISEGYDKDTYLQFLDLSLIELKNEIDLRETELSIMYPNHINEMVSLKYKKRTENFVPITKINRCVMRGEMIKRNALNDARNEMIILRKKYECCDPESYSKILYFEEMEDLMEHIHYIENEHPLQFLSKKGKELTYFRVN